MRNNNENLIEFVQKIKHFTGELGAISQLPPIPGMLSSPITYTMCEADWIVIQTFVQKQTEIFDALQKRHSVSSRDNPLYVNLTDIADLLILLSGHIRASSTNYLHIISFIDTLFPLCLEYNQIHMHLCYFLAHMSTTSEGATRIMNMVDLKTFLFKIEWEDNSLPCRKTSLKLQTVMHISKVFELRRTILVTQEVQASNILIDFLIIWINIIGSKNDNLLLGNELLRSCGLFIVKTQRNLSKVLSDEEKEHWYGIVHKKSQVFSKLLSLFGQDFIPFNLRILVLDLMTHTIYDMTNIRDLPESTYKDRDKILNILKGFIDDIQITSTLANLPFEKCMYHIYHSLQKTLSCFPDITDYNIIRPFQELFLQSTILLDKLPTALTYNQQIQLELCCSCFQSILKIDNPAHFTRQIMLKVKNVCQWTLDKTFNHNYILLHSINTLCNHLGRITTLEPGIIQFIGLIYQLLFRDENSPKITCLLLRCLSNICVNEGSTQIILKMGYPKILDFCADRDEQVFVDAFFLTSLFIHFNQNFLLTMIKLNHFSALYRHVFLHLDDQVTCIPDLRFKLVEKKQLLYDVLIKIVYTAVMTLREDFLGEMIKIGYASVFIHHQPSKSTENGLMISKINEVFKCFKSEKNMTFEKFGNLRGFKITTAALKRNKIRKGGKLSINNTKSKPLTKKR